MAILGATPIDFSRMRINSPGFAVMVVTLYFISSPPVRLMMRGAPADSNDPAVRNRIKRMADTRRMNHSLCTRLLFAERPDVSDERVEIGALQLRVAGHQRLALDRAAHGDHAPEFHVGQRAHVGAVSVVARLRLQGAGRRSIAASRFPMTRHAIGLVE